MSYEWRGGDQVIKMTESVRTSMPKIDVEITHLDISRVEYASAISIGGITATIRVRSEAFQTQGTALLTDSERDQLLTLLTAIEERLMEATLS